METIEVRYVPIWWTGNIAYHKYIVYTDANGNKYAARGGPASGSSPGFPFGPIETQHGPYNDTFPDWDPENNDPRETITTGDDLSQEWEKIREAMDDIKNEKHPYNPITRNSNGTVDEALDRANLPQPQLDDPGENYSPGSGGLTPSIPSDVSDDFTRAQETPAVRRDPLTFDLDGDGIETVGIDPNNPILFDHDGDGLKTATGWVKADDAFLVLDRNEDGTIDDGTELFGDSTPVSDGQGGTRKAVDGFDALADQDTNADGQVNANDANFSRLRLWQDLNQNGLSETGELFTLNQKGIAAITVAKTENSILLPNGNVIADLGHYTKTDGSEGTLGDTAQLGDVDLREDTFYSQFTDSVPLTPEAEALPNIGGSGQVKSLHEAASLSPDLTTLLQQYTVATTRTEQIAQLDALLKGWSDTSTMPTTATGAYDGHPLQVVFQGTPEGSPEHQAWLDKLTVLERFNGRTFRQVPSGTDPVTVGFAGLQLPALDRAYNTLRAAVYESLFPQTRGKLYLDAIGLTVNDTGEVALDFSAMQQLLDEKFLTDPLKGFGDLVDLYAAQGEDLMTSGWNGIDYFAHAKEMLGTTEVGRAVLADPSQVGPHTGAVRLGRTTDETLQGDGHTNVMFAGAGNDSLHDFGGDNVLYGGSGNDFFEVDDGDNYLDGEEGNDYFLTGSGDDTVLGGDGDDELRDFGGNNTFDGGEGNDRIEVYARGNNTLIGGDGDDELRAYESRDHDSTNDHVTLIGGTGNDYLYGGSSADTYVFNRGDGQDVIVDDPFVVQWATDTILFGAGIDPGDIQLWGSSYDGLVVRVLDPTNPSSLDQITIAGNYLYQPDYTVETFVFADGTVWDEAAITAHRILTPATEGDDYLYGTLRDDAISGLAGDDLIVGFEGDDVIEGGAGDDLIEGHLGSDRLVGDEGNDILLGGVNGLEDYGFDSLFGGSGDDQLHGGLGDDFLDGDEGNDWLSGGSGTNTLIGGLGDDTYSVGGPGDVIIENPNEGTDTVQSGFSYVLGDNLENLRLLGTEHLIGTGNALDNVIRGDSGNDTLIGLGGNDALYGDYDTQSVGFAFGNDILDGGTGDDYLDGGYGDDTYIFARGYGQDRIRETDGSVYWWLDWANGNDTLRLDGLLPDDISVGRNGGDLTITVTDTGDRIVFSQVEQAVFADGTVWSSELLGLFADGVTFGPDILTGTDGHDTLNGLSGDDTLYGLAGYDTLIGGEGNDLLDGGADSDSLYGNAGDDTLLGGGEGYDYLDGGEGNDTLDGGAGGDEMRGGLGDDSYVVDHPYDQVREYSNEGTDTVFASIDYALVPLGLPDGGEIASELGFWFFDIGIENITLIGDDNLQATGSPGDNVLTGNRGDNLLNGFGGNDLLIGGAGNDTYLFDAMPDLGGDLPGPVLFVSDIGRGRPGPGLPVPSSLVIEENDATPGNLDFLVFGSGLDFGDMTAEAVDRDLVLRFDSGEQVTVRNWYRGAEHHVELLQFADGTVLETAAIAPVVASPPVIVSPVTDLNMDEDSDLSLNVASAFSDPDGDILGYTAALNDGTALPDWLIFDPVTGTFTGTPGNQQVGSYAIVLTASDPDGLTVSDEFVLTVNNVNDTPVVINPIPDQSTGEDAPFSFTLDAGLFGDDDFIHGDSLTLSVSLADGNDLPSWLAFDAATGSFSGIPTNGDVGSYDFRVTATDESGAITSTDFALTVNNTNDIPIVANSIPDQSTDEDSPYTFNLADVFTDDDLIHGDSLTLSASLVDGSVLPDWLSFDTLTGMFSGTPDNGAVGTYEIQVTATDLAGTSASDVFTLTVNNVNDNPVLANALGDLTTDEDAPFSFTVPPNTFFDDDFIHGDTLTLSAVLADGTDLPTWLSFDAATGTFTGTPDNWEVGNYDIRVTATDLAGTSVFDDFVLAVNNTNDAPVLVNSLTDQLVTEGTAFSYILPEGTFTDDDAIHGDVLTYEATLSDGSALPAWLSFDTATQTFTGTASADSTLLGTDGDDVLVDSDTGISGTWDIQVTATDTSGISASDTFTLTLQGVAGNDTLTGGKGNDVLNGGGGNDTYIYNLGDGLDTLTDRDGTDTVAFGPGISFDNTVLRTEGGVAHLRLLDTDGCETEAGMDITLNPDGSSPIETFAFENGTTYSLNDLLITSQTWYGDKKANTIITGRNDDTVYAGKGGDTVYTGTGNDTLHGEKGKDHLYGEGGNDTLYGGKGDDLLNGGCGNDLLDGGKGHNTLIGGKGNDTLILAEDSESNIYFNQGDGWDTLKTAAKDEGHDNDIYFGQGITQQNLWFSRTGNDLSINILGTHDGMTLEGWYSNKHKPIEEIKTANGYELEDKQIELLVQAMASFTPTPGSGTPLPTEMPNELQATLAAAWEN